MNYLHLRLLQTDPWKVLVCTVKIWKTIWFLIFENKKKLIYDGLLWKCLSDWSLSIIHKSLDAFERALNDDSDNMIGFSISYTMYTPWI